MLRCELDVHQANNETCEESLSDGVECRSARVAHGRSPLPEFKNQVNASIPERVALLERAVGTWGSLHEIGSYNFHGSNARSSFGGSRLVLPSERRYPLSFAGRSDLIAARLSESIRNPRLGFLRRPLQVAQGRHRRRVTKNRHGTDDRSTVSRSRVLEMSCNEFGPRRDKVHRGGTRSASCLHRPPAKSSPILHGDR